MRARAAVIAAVIAAAGCAPGTRRSDPAIQVIAVSRSGQFVAAATRGGALAVWKGPRLIRFEAHAINGRINDLDFSPDERRLAVADRNLRVEFLEPRRRMVLRGDGRNYGTARFHPSRDSLLTVTGSGSIELLDANSGAALWSVCCSSVAGAAAFSPDGAVCAAGGHMPRLWDAGTGRLVAGLTREREFMLLGPVAFRGGDVLMGSQDGRIRAWSWKTGQAGAGSPAAPGWVDTIAVQEGTGTVAYASFGGALRLWHPAAHAMRTVRGAAPTSNLAFGGGGLLAFGTAGGTVEMWDVAGDARRGSLGFSPVK